MKQLIGICIAAITGFTVTAQPNRQAQDSLRKLTEQDYQNMMEQLHITSIRQGANGNDPSASNAANYDEAKANPYPNLPDALTLKNGKKVSTAKTWWEQRRPEITEDFDREIYGRMPKKTPGVTWEVTNTTNEKNGDIDVITKKLIGHVDNSSYPEIKVDIQLTLTTPANAAGPVPVIMEFGFIFPSGFRFPTPPRDSSRPAPAAPPAPTGPTWQQQVLAKDGVTQSFLLTAYRQIMVQD